MAHREPILGNGSLSYRAAVARPPPSVRPQVIPPTWSLDIGSSASTAFNLFKKDVSNVIVALLAFSYDCKNFLDLGFL